MQWRCSRTLSPSTVKKRSAPCEAERAVKRITFNPTEANSGETLYVSVPKLNANEVLVPGSLALIFDLDLTGGNANNYLVQNVSRALVDKMVVKFAGHILQETVGYDIYKIFEDLFLPKEERDNMLLEGIQSVNLSKIRSGAGDKPTSGVAAENKLVYKKKYKIRLDSQILTDHGVFYPQALYNDLTFDLTLAQPGHVVRGSDTTKLVYKLKNIQLEYEMFRSVTLADQANSVYYLGKEFLYDHVQRDKVIKITRATDTRVNLRVNPERRSLKGILLLFIEPYTLGARDSEKYFNPDITKIAVTINGSPNQLYNEELHSEDFWKETSRFFLKKSDKKKHVTRNMDAAKFYTGDKFGVLIDLHSMIEQDLHGSGTRLVNTQDGVQLEIERTGSGSGNVNCHIYLISDSQMNIQGRQLESVQY